eukprot:7681914-Pyramimonas_sp.AAC.1
MIHLADYLVGLDTDMWCPQTCGGFGGGAIGDTLRFSCGSINPSLGVGIMAMWSALRDSVSATAMGFSWNPMRGVEFSSGYKWPLKWHLKRTDLDSDAFSAFP